VTGLRGRAGIAGGALIIAALGGFAIPAATTTAPALAATTPARGVDVSSLQHPTATSTIDWASVASSGAQFAGIKVSEGNYYTNPYYAGDAAKSEQADAAQAVAAGLYVTPYVFANPYNSTPTGNGTAAQQADYAVGVINASTSPAYATDSHMLPVTVDLENDPYVNSETGANQCYGLSPSNMVTWISQFLTEIKSKLGTSKVPMIYTTANWWNTCTGSSTAFSGYPLWLAAYQVTNPALPVGWNNPTMWQYSDTGTVSGISGSVDLDELAPVLQVSQSGKAIGAVKLRTLTSLAGQADTYSSPTGLPPDLQLSSSGQITGTPTTPGAYTVTVATSGVPSSMSFTWDVHGTITVTSPGNLTTTAGSPVWLKVPVTDPDGGSYLPTVTASGLPPGMVINKNGVITGWPTKPGTYTVRVSASDALYASGSASFTWTIAAAANTGFTGLIRQVGGTAKCLNDPGASTANGTLLNLWTCTGGNPQAWTTVQDGTIRALGKCLTVFHNTTVELYACASSGSAQQQWRAGTDGELVNAQYGTCLYFANANAVNGSKPTMSACADVTTQSGEHWSRTAANVYSPAPGKCLAASGTAAGSAVVLAGCATVAAQRWVMASDGTIRLGAYCLTEAGTTAGSALTIGSCSGAATTNWTVVSGTGPQEPASPIATEIASANSASSGMCVTTPASGSKVNLQACSPTTATPANTWHIE
jgi:GH25 family lysozyme M1 (1,4-beta-N-acetylmuramidase)